jgi:uncharacterized protein
MWGSFLRLSLAALIPLAYLQELSFKMVLGLGQLLIFAGIIALLYLSQRFWFRSLWNISDKFRSRAAQKLVRGAAVAGLLLLIFSFLDRLLGRSWIVHNPITRFLFTITQLWVVSSMMAYLFYVVVRAVEWIWSLGSRVIRRTPITSATNEDRRAFFRYSARFAAAVPLVAAVYGYTAERFNYQVRRVDIPIANLPPQLDGLKITQVSDIHIGDFMPRAEVRRAIDIANELGGDVVFVTGDLITGPHDPLRECVEEVARLHAPLGVWGCNGNHEIYADAEDEAQLLYSQHGMKLLRQERAELEWHGAKLNLVGVDYQRDHMVRGPKPPMLAGLDPLIRRDMPNILLSHNPNSFYKAAELGIELSLAGHTHGGQVDVEILDQDVNPSRFITKFIAGLYRLPFGGVAASHQGKEASLYVNRGLGTIGLPARFGVDPEISLLTLRRA